MGMKSINQTVQIIRVIGLMLMLNNEIPLYFGNNRQPNCLWFDQVYNEDKYSEIFDSGC